MCQQVVQELGVFMSIGLFDIDSRRSARDVSSAVPPDLRDQFRAAQMEFANTASQIKGALCLGNNGFERGIVNN